jgi:lactate racemase
MLKARVIAPDDDFLSEDQINDTLHKAFDGDLKNQKVLVLIPDHTRTLPLPFLFNSLTSILKNVRQLDFLIALGTHPPLSEQSINRLVGITAEERKTKFSHVGLFNHDCKDPSALTTLGMIENEEIKTIAGPRWHNTLPEQVEIRINKAVLEYDHIIILGPTFPHEVVGFSGGAKYLFPGISGPEMINVTHWLGALAGVVDTIGIKNTPVRDMIHSATTRLQVPITLIALIVEENNLSGLFIGDHINAWNEAAELSAQRHISWVDKPFKRVLSCAPPMYDELWTAGKAMYKLEPAVAMGGEVIIYAPHLDTISQVHGKYIYEVGYHILPYYLADWSRYQHIPLGVLAHSTHVRGSGSMDRGIEKPNVKVTLSSKISADDCERLNLGYIDPESIIIEDWKEREEDGVLLVPKAGETLYRVRK